MSYYRKLKTKLLDYNYTLHYIKKLLSVNAVPHTALLISHCGRRGGLMVGALDSGASGPGSNPGQGHQCVVFLGKTLYSHDAYLHPGVKMGTANLMLGGNPAMD